MCKPLDLIYRLLHLHITQVQTSGEWRREMWKSSKLPFFIFIRIHLNNRRLSMLRVHHFPKKLATLPDWVALWVQASKTVESQNGAWIQFGSGPPPSENIYYVVCINIYIPELRWLKNSTKIRRALITLELFDISRHSRDT